MYQLQGGHQSLPVNSIRIGLPCLADSALAFSKLTSQPSAAEAPEMTRVDTATMAARKMIELGDFMVQKEYTASSFLAKD